MFKISKVLKTFLIVFISIILFIFLVLLVTPLLFKDQLMNLAKTELNKMLLAKVDFKDLKLSFIRNFPNAYIGLDGLEVTGVDEFEGELLVAFDRFSVTVDLMSVIKMDNIEVKSILLDRARLNGIIMENGKANWEIFKPGEAKEEDEEKKEVSTEKKESDPFKFKVGLSKFEIRDLKAAFRDDKNKMKGEIEALNLTVRGDMKKENVDLKLKLAIDGIDFWLGGIRLANKVTVGFISDVAADLRKFKFTLKDNKFNLNDIVLKLDGSAELQLPDIIADLTFATEKTDFKSLLSLVPAVYMNDFKDLRTTGSLSLNGGIKGTYNNKMMPSANVNLSVNNATFSYPNLPKSVDKINIALRAHYDGEVFDRTTADIDRFSFEIAGNPFNAEVHLKTPESDPGIFAKFAGKIDFDSVVDIIPLDDLTLNGLLECDIALAGNLSTIKKEQYQDFQAEGHLKLNGFYFKNPDFPQGAQITSTHLNFSPRFVQLVNLDLITGNSDVSLSGSLENFIPFVLKNETVKGSLALNSKKIDLNEFMSSEKKEEAPVKEKTETTQEEKTQLSVIEVPKNIDFSLNVNIGQILFDKLSISNTRGEVTVRDGRLVMRNLAMNLLDGSMTLNGEYNTQNITVPFVDLGIDIRQFNITTALSSFEFLEKILPEPQNYVGRVSANLTLNSVLDEHLSPVLDKINAKGRLQTQNLEIRNSKLFGVLADLIKNESWRTPAPGNLNIGFEVKNGRLYIDDPITINISPVRMEIKGDQGLDMTLNYTVSAFVPISVIGSGATSLLNSIPGGSRVNEIKLSGHIKGNVKNPDIGLGASDMAGSLTTVIREQVTEVVTQKVEEVRTQVNEEVNRQIDQIMAEANKQADNLRSTAKTAADRTRREANAAADKLMNEAGSNPIQRRLAQVAADKLRSEGETAAVKLEQEADTQANNVIAAAQRRADELRRN